MSIVYKAKPNRRLSLDRPVQGGLQLDTCTTPCHYNADACWLSNHGGWWRHLVVNFGVTCLNKIVIQCIFYKFSENKCVYWSFIFILYYIVLFYFIILFYFIVLIFANSKKKSTYPGYKKKTKYMFGCWLAWFQTEWVKGWWKYWAQ